MSLTEWRTRVDIADYLGPVNPGIYAVYRVHGTEDEEWRTPVVAIVKVEERTFKAEPGEGIDAERANWLDSHPETYFMAAVFDPESGVLEHIDESSGFLRIETE